MYHILVPYRRTGPAPNVCARSEGKTGSEKQEFWRADEWRRGIAAASALVGMSRVSAGIFIREPAPGHIESSIPRRMPADNLFVRRCLPSNVPHLRNRLTDRRRHSGFRAFFVRSIVFRHQPIRSNQRLRLFRRQPPSFLLRRGHRSRSPRCLLKRAAAAAPATAATVAAIATGRAFL